MVAQARTRPTADDRIRAALWFADHGFGVFSVWSTTEAGTCRCPKGLACDNAGKHPVTQHGFQDATTDPERIRAMLSAGSLPNYGMVCPEGVFALDVDGDGVARLADLEARLGALPPTLRTQTANGQHVFLRWPDEHPRPLKQLFGYVTRWRSGRHAGYVIGPRSVHASGAVYAPAGGILEIATLPTAWVLAALSGEEPATITIGGKLPDVGGRHDWLRDRARYYRGFMEDREVLRAALLAENARLPHPKAPPEVDRAIGDVFERFPLDAPEEAEERVARKLGEDELGLLSKRATGDFPPPPIASALRGLLGECVLEIASGTDASLVGMLGCFISFCGALIPGQAYFHGTQTSSPYVALVGESAVGRKGTAMRRVRDAIATAIEPMYVNRVILDGLNSGEGLVSTLHYKREAFPYEPTVGLVYEEEYATLLAARGRDGSTLDPKMRQAFDGGPLSNRRSNDTKTITPPYWLPALIAITPDELRVRLEAGALQSGSANRWLYLAVVKRDHTATNAQPALTAEQRAAIAAARRWALDGTRELAVSPVVTETLGQYADFLPTVSHGLSRDLTRRLSVIAFRVALVHALAERSPEVTVDHMERALALTEYAREGIAWIFGQTIGSPDADLLLRHLVAAGRLTKRAITQEILRDPIRRQAAIDELIRLGRAEVANVHTSGRPRTELVLTGSKGGFCAFDGVSYMRDPRNEPDFAQKVGFEHETPAQKVHESSTEGAQKVHGTARNEAVMVACDDYTAHQTSHRWDGHGWICDACGA